MKNKHCFLIACNLILTVSFIHAQNKPEAPQNANTTLSNLTSPTKVNANLLPDKNNKRDLGSLNKAWKKLYLDSAIYLDSIRFIAFRTGNGDGNTAIGKDVLYSDTSGYSNTAVGYKSIYYNTSGYENTAMGRGALYENTSGSDNTAIGYHSLYSNGNAQGNTAIGYGVLRTSYGNFNAAVGWEAMYNNYGGHDNAAIGDAAMFNNTSGGLNAAVGYAALISNKTGGSNTGIGEFADVNSGGLFDATALGSNTIATASYQVRIGDNDVSSIGGYKAWTNISDGRIKKNIKTNVPGLSFINLLKPVTYTLDLDAADKVIQRLPKTDKNGKIIQQSAEEMAARKAQEQTVCTGFVAQEVEAAAKNIGYDFDGVDAPKNSKDLFGLRYSEFVVPLVKAVQELSSQNDSLKSEIKNLRSEIENIKAIIVSNQSTVNSQQSTLVSSASLSQNIPNPFSNSTTINYTLQQKYSSAKIIITDENGNALKQINLPAGRQSLLANKSSVNVDGAMLTSGDYQYSLYVDGKLIDTKQMISAK